MKYIYSTSQMSKLSLTLCTFSITGLVAGLFLTIIRVEKDAIRKTVKQPTIWDNLSIKEIKVFSEIKK